MSLVHLLQKLAVSERLQLQEAPKRCIFHLPSPGLQGGSAHREADLSRRPHGSWTRPCRRREPCYHRGRA